MKQLKMKKNIIIYALLGIAFVVTFSCEQLGLMSRQMESLLVPICINIILAVSLNLVIGFLGELSLGHAGFMSVGAYAGSLFAIKFQDILPAAPRFILAMIVGAIVAGLLGFLIGIPVLRLNGDYLAIVTLAFGQIILSVILNLGFTGGASGLKGTPQDSSFFSAFIVLLLVVIISLNIANSKYGRSIMAIRDNRIAAQSCGINVKHYKLTIFSLSAAIAGVAGVLYSHNFTILKAGEFDFNKSIEILVFVVLGGMGNIGGSIISAIVLTLLPELLRHLGNFSQYRMLIYSILLIVIMIFSSSPAFKNLKIRKLFTKNRKADESDG